MWILLACPGSFLSGGNLPPAQCEPGATREGAIQHCLRGSCIRRRIRLNGHAHECYDFIVTVARRVWQTVTVKLPRRSVALLEPCCNGPKSGSQACNPGWRFAPPLTARAGRTRSLSPQAGDIRARAVRRARLGCYPTVPHVIEANALTSTALEEARPFEFLHTPTRTRFLCLQANWEDHQGRLRRYQAMALPGHHPKASRNVR